MIESMTPVRTPPRMGLVPRRVCRSGPGLAALAMTLAAMPLKRADAGVEFVTKTTDCSIKVDLIGDGKDLFIIAGPNIQFEVWGNSVDLSNPTSGFRIAVDAGAGNVTARIVQQRSGAANLARGCGNTGSAVVEVDSPADIGSTLQRSLFFKMPFGDESRLQISIKPFPTFSATWVNPALSCIVKTGTLQLLDQDTRIVLQLPPGHQQDQTTCNSNSLSARISPADMGELDIVGPNFRYTFGGLPAFMTGNQASTIPPNGFPGLLFTINVAGIRALATASISAITLTNPLNTNRSTTLRMEVRPNLGQGFATVASANPRTLTAGDPVDFTLTLSAPAAANQIITWRMTTPTCFVQANIQSPYNANAPFQFFTFPQGQTSAIIRVRSQDGAGCTNVQTLITHVFEAWIGDSRTNAQVTAVTSGPTYTRANIALRSPTGE